MSASRGSRSSARCIDSRRVDRFGSTPIEEARRGGHRTALPLLASHLATAT